MLFNMYIVYYSPLNLLDNGLETLIIIIAHESWRSKTIPLSNLMFISNRLLHYVGKINMFTFKFSSSGYLHLNEMYSGVSSA